MTFMEIYKRITQKTPPKNLGLCAVPDSDKATLPVSVESLAAITSEEKGLNYVYVRCVCVCHSCGNCGGPE